MVQRNFNNHWGRENPWRDKTGQEIPHFIEDLAKRTAAYKQLELKFPDQPDSITYYLNKPYRLKVLTAIKVPATQQSAQWTPFVTWNALCTPVRGHGAANRTRKSLGGRH
ncbi:MAG: hypothetical protein R2738_06915 [Bacteroides graminisolvens]